MEEEREVSVGNALVDIVCSVGMLPAPGGSWECPGCVLGSLGHLGSPWSPGLPGCALGPLHQPIQWQHSPCCHTLPLPAGLPGDAVRVLEAVDVRQVHVLGHARHVRRVQLLVAVGTPAKGIILVLMRVKSDNNFEFTTLFVGRVFGSCAAGS